MGFLDKAKKLAEQAQSKLDEVQSQINTQGAPRQPSGPVVEYDKHGRPIPPQQTATPPHGAPLAGAAPAPSYSAPSTPPPGHPPAASPPPPAHGDPLGGGWSQPAPPPPAPPQPPTPPQPPAAAGPP